MIEAIAAIGLGATPVDRSGTAASSAVMVGPSFTDTLRSAAAGTVTTVKSSEKLAARAVMGTASLQEVVQATVAAELAMETAISVRNKVIEGYQEIMRMPV
jgi:flagellar hook-basal body complex protein FliE